MRNLCQWVGVALLAGVLGCGRPAGDTAAGRSGEAGKPETAAPRPETVAQGPVRRMNAVEARAFLAGNPTALVLDVRQPQEWDDDLGHIDGARLIPLPELMGRLREIDAWRSQPMLVICRSGSRSLQASLMLGQQGFEDIIHVDGGMVDWRQAEVALP